MADHTAERRQQAILDAFVHLADTLVEDYDVIEFLYYLTEQCVDLVDASEAAVMLAAPNGRLQAVASSSERSRLLELFELQNRDGPCLDAFNTGSTVASDDLANDLERWPAFAPEALHVGIRSVHSVPLRLRDDVIGALNLLLTRSGGLAEPDVRLARALSDIATIGVLQDRVLSRTQEQASGLQHALTSRIRIEQAKGILAERYGLTVDEAFERMRSHARRHQHRLTDVAIGVVTRRLTLDEDAPPS